MMIQFMGRSGETHQIKHKPIGKGYKLFTLTTFRGFIVNFTLDGRTAAKGKNKKNTQEYETQEGTGKDTVNDTPCMWSYYQIQTKATGSLWNLP